MNQPNTCPNFSTELGNQICRLTLNVSPTIAPCLYLFVCQAEYWGGAQEGFVYVLGEASLSRSHPCANPFSGAMQNRPSHSSRTKPSHAHNAQLYLSAACLLILICMEAIPSPLANWVSQWAADFFEVTVGKYALKKGHN